MGRPIPANLPTYYVPFSSHNAQPTYLPKVGTSLMDIPKSEFDASLDEFSNYYKGAIQQLRGQNFAFFDPPPLHLVHIVTLRSLLNELACLIEIWAYWMAPRLFDFLNLSIVYLIEGTKLYLS